MEPYCLDPFPDTSKSDIEIDVREVFDPAYGDYSRFSADRTKVICTGTYRLLHALRDSTDEEVSELLRLLSDQEFLAALNHDSLPINLTEFKKARSVMLKSLRKHYMEIPVARKAADGKGPDEVRMTRVAYHTPLDIIVDRIDENYRSEWKNWRHNTATPVVLSHAMDSQGARDAAIYHQVPLQNGISRTFTRSTPPHFACRRTSSAYIGIRG
jgi:hypothetical protein